jgi:RHH-type transcriptional regulator, proline utilization regulon repressor / proline dehydrogenase / delta 1-pyrroline-5-carboxylate dehydrogenase
MGNHFVLGQTIEEALKRAGSGAGRLYRYSFDMLGEGARTWADAERYWHSYADAIRAIGAQAGNAALPDRPGISVKLSALHPRYEAINRQAVLDDLVPRLRALALLAKGFDMNFTIDAEEADRLELSLDVIAASIADPALADWDGFGLAIQAYQKRALATIEWLDDLAKRHERRFMVRLVKGAYWDSEIKRAQERGLDGYPVFTRKAMTDLSYLACAKRLLQARPRLFAQFATHNALTIASVLAMADTPDGFEFQRLHGMGEAAYEWLLARKPGLACRTYAPVGGHRDLLAYLVRRLLENGANSSFVNVAADPATPVETLLKRPQDWLGSPDKAYNHRIPLPADLYGPGRRNAQGVEFGHRESLDHLLSGIEAARKNRPRQAAPIIDGRERTGVSSMLRSPIDGTPVGQVTSAAPDLAPHAVEAARHGFSRWSKTAPAERAQGLRRAADLLQDRRFALLALLMDEAGKTIDDAVAELREAIDFCRYYANEAERHFGTDTPLPGPTGEENSLRYRARGVFICISPWNFPLAIFLGQVTAALAAGNSVVAKPAEQTPLIAALAVSILHEAGIPGSALHLMPGDGTIGAALVAHPAIAGVAFTGSTETAWRINRSLAAKDGPIVPLIAETGGINAMIVDATALPEQVADDVVISAFRSAGQRCSALRLLCVQDDVAERMIELIVGAAKTLRIGDPRHVSTHIGPVIDAEAKATVESHVEKARKLARAVPLATDLADRADLAAGTYIGPQIIEIASADALKHEIFGPVLHVVRWKADALDRLLDQIAASGYGLTLGVHTRIDATAQRVMERLSNGNVYVNRNMIGAVVGVQPFGGSGLSGTGPKAGGPDYLPRFALEQVVSINTAAAGGNASLLAAGEA